MADIAFFRCTTCRCFAINQPESPTHPTRLYENPHLDPLFPRDGTWQHDATEEGDVECNPGPPGDEPPAKRTRHQKKLHAHMLEGVVSVNVYSRLCLPFCILCLVHGFRRWPSFGPHCVGCDLNLSSPPPPAKTPYVPQGGTGITTSEIGIPTCTRDPRLPQRSIRRTPRICARPYPRRTQYIHNPTEDRDTEPNPGRDVFIVQTEVLSD